MRLEDGKFYRTRGGRKVGPLKYVDGRNLKWFEGHLEGEDRVFRLNGVHDFGDRDLDLIAEWTDGPVRTFTRREVVAGQYADVDVGAVVEIPDCDNPDVPPVRKVAVAYAGFRSSTELKAAAAVLLELAGALDSE